MVLAAGSMVSPSVRLVRLLGKGGMGSVWVAEHLTLKTLVAVKFMSEGFAQSPGAVARFEREAVAAAQIKSPHVVQVFDHGVDEAGVPYIVMELMEGEDLAHRLAAVGHLSPMHTAQIVGQVCKALSKAHAAQIVHRDIKADNIFLVHSDDDVFVKVLDFGIAKTDDAPSSHLTSTGAVVGTPHTMSPEQILSSKHVDFRSDLWSVGVVAYQCITGTLPFDGDTFGAIAIAIDRATFPPASARCPGLPPQLDAWFSRALARDSGARFGSAREMSDELFKAVGIIRASDTGDSSISGARAPSAAVSATSTSVDPTLAPATLPSGKGSSARVRLLAGAVAAVLLAGFGLFAVLRDDTPTPVAPESSQGASRGATPGALAATQAPSVAPAALPVIDTGTPPAPEPPPSASSSAPSRPQSTLRGAVKGPRTPPPAEPSQHKPVPAKPPQGAFEERDRGF